MYLQVEQKKVAVNPRQSKHIIKNRTKKVFDWKLYEDDELIFKHRKKSKTFFYWSNSFSVGINYRFNYLADFDWNYKLHSMF